MVGMRLLLAAFVIVSTVSAQLPPVAGTPVQAAVFRYIETAPGSGAPAKPGQRYKVHYTGYFTDEKKFDSSVDRKEPFTFVQGRRQVIPGWDAGFEGMKVGGKRRLFVPYQMAYGEKGIGPIPPKANLVFDVELLGVEDIPEMAPSIDVLAPLEDLEEKTVALAKAMPEEKYDYLPSPGVRSFREVMLHIHYANLMLLEIANGKLEGDALKQRIAANANGEKQKLPKEKILWMLAESFAAARKAISPLRQGQLAADMTVFGQATTRRGAYVMLDVHNGEHLGQAIAYARINGITPPWTEQQQQK